LIFFGSISAFYTELTVGKIGFYVFRCNVGGGRRRADYQLVKSGCKDRFDYLYGKPWVGF